MRAIVVREFGEYREQAKLENLPMPALGPGEVLVEARASGVSFAMSLIIAGRYQRKPDLPFTPGTEGAGLVRAVGDGVIRVSPGDHVMCNLDSGGHSEFFVTRDICCHKIPDDVDFAVGTMLILSYCTSYGALTRRAKLQSGETLLVHGAAGAVGLAAVEIGKALGAQVIAVAGGAEHCAFANKHGADHVLDHRACDFREEALALTAGRGVDVVYDSIGGEVTRQSIRTLAPEGRLLTIGYASGDIPTIPANLLLVKNIAAMGFNLGHFFGWSPGGTREEHSETMDMFVAEVLALHRQDKIKPEIGARYPLDKFSDALDAVLARKVNGKCVVEFFAE